MSHAQDATSHASAPDLQAGEVIACRYRVESHDRTHPLGELYRCRDQNTGKLVSLQRLRREFTLPGVQDRLFETRGSATLHSKVIADILDYGEDIDGRSFLVTPWSDHPSLDSVERPLGFAEAVAIVERVATALAPLHAQGMLHGGIEPASVLVDSQRELTGLLGFGLAPALAAAAERGRALPLLASPAYAAPELITGASLGPQTDVYALGILLWELIFGQPPFRGATLRVLDSHLNRSLPEFELPFDAPASLEWVLGWMLAKNPAERFADAGAVAEQLHALLLEAPQPELIVDADPTDEEEDDETVVFEAVREQSLELPRMLPRVQSCDDLSDSFELPRSRLWPKLALAVSMCASLVLLGSWALEREQVEAGPVELTNAAVGERALSSASTAEPQIVAATASAPGPIAAATVEESPKSKLRDKLTSSNFRSKKQQLYADVQRTCTSGDVRRTVKVAVRVDARGRVEAASALGKMGTSKLGGCVEQQARGLTFPASATGGFYIYTLRLR